MGWAILGSLWPWKGEKKDELKIPMTESQRERYMKRWKSFEQESKRLPPNYGKFQGGDLNDDPLFDHKENPTPEEVEENQKVWEKLRNGKFLKFLAKSDEYADAELQEELEENKFPFWEEDESLWEALPNVPQPYTGLPMPKKAIRRGTEAENKIFDFLRQYLFGLWQYEQRPYPPCKPIDVTQALGVEFLNARYYDFVMRYGNWYYKDRLGRTRGPMELINLRTALASGIVDKDTFVWGDDMDEWTPIGMINGLEAAVNTADVKLAAAGAALGHKLARGLPLWIPAKGREIKTYKQLQMEGIESKEREKAAMRQYGGVLPGQMIPSHTLFLWASGTELTPLIERDTMPNKYVSYNLRKYMAKAVPGLRPWEVLTMEQVMDKITYGGWYREPLGSYNTGPSFAERPMDYSKYYSNMHYLPEDSFLDDVHWLFYNARYYGKKLRKILGEDFYRDAKKRQREMNRIRYKKKQIQENKETLTLWKRYYEKIEEGYDI